MLRDKLMTPAETKEKKVGCTLYLTVLRYSSERSLVSLWRSVTGAGGPLHPEANIDVRFQASRDDGRDDDRLHCHHLQWAFVLVAIEP